MVRPQIEIHISPKSFISNNSHNPGFQSKLHYSPLLIDQTEASLLISAQSKHKCVGVAQFTSRLEKPTT